MPTLIFIVHDTYGEVLASAGATQTNFGFTGEQVDANGLVYLRIRYYNPALGIFTVLDPLEGGMRQPMSLNRYSYVHSNVVNRVDPSGMCPPFSHPYEAGTCEALRGELSTWGINVRYHSKALDPIPCLPEEVDKAINEINVNQRWTTNEMVAIYNAFRIFALAHSRFKQLPGGNRYDFNWPLKGSEEVNIVKRAKLPSPAIDGDLGIHLINERTIALSSIYWGDHSSIILGQTSPQGGRPIENQYRSWIVLHEFSHVFAEDRAKVIAPKISRGIWTYLQSTLVNELDFTGLNIIAPSDYMLINTGSDQERVIEAVAGTIWNYGFDAVDTYKSGAGGRTAPVGNPNEFGKEIRNVRDITAIREVDGVGKLSVIKEGMTLEEWALDRIILGPDLED